MHFIFMEIEGIGRDSLKADLMFGSGLIIDELLKLRSEQFQKRL
jgi:hypothetical protein